MSIQQQVSRAIRILRGNRDVSARASHLVVQKDQLMTYEVDSLSQAEMKKFFKSTFSERKIMSTKTSFKRIAAVAAVALTLGGFSAVSANAASNPLAVAYSTDYAASTINLGQDAVLVLHQDFTASGAANTDTLTVQFTVTQNAYGSTTSNSTWPVVYGGVAGTTSTGTTAEVAAGYAAGAVYNGFPSADVSGGLVNLNDTQTVTGSGTTVSSVSNANAGAAGTHTRGFERIQWRPTVAGTYSLKVTDATAAAGSANALWSYTWTFTVVDAVAAAATAAAAAATAAAAALVPSVSYSTTTLGYGYANCTTIPTCDSYGPWYARSAGYPNDSVYASDSLAAGTANLVGIGQESAGSLVTVNATTSVGTTIVPLVAPTIWAEITSGPGILQLTTDPGVVLSQGRNISGTTTGNLAKVLLFSDGHSGVTTYNIYASTTATSTKVLLGTKTVTFFDTPTKITPTALVNAIQGDAGSTSTVAASLAVTDQDGYFVPGTWLAANGYVGKLTSGTTTMVASQASGIAFAKRPTGDLVNVVSLQPMGAVFGTVSLTASYTNDTGGFTAATGYSNAAKTLVAKTATSAAWTTVVSSKTASAMSVTADASSYAPGGIVTLTIKGLDSNGLILPDAINYAITSSSDISVASFNTTGVVALPSTQLSTSVKFGGLTSGTADTGAVWSYASTTPGVYTVKFYAPLVTGPFNIAVKLGSTNFATAIAATTTTLALNVGISAATQASIDAAQAAQDAANEATDAANAATDAANNAMDSADAAQQAAMDAGDKADAALAAVTDLASKVSEIAAAVTALSSVVSKIAAAVAKISKKVKA
jgi:trimeric autotransporter adhesin